MKLSKRKLYIVEALFHTLAKRPIAFVLRPSQYRECVKVLKDVESHQEPGGYRNSDESKDLSGHKIHTIPISARRNHVIWYEGKRAEAFFSTFSNQPKWRHITVSYCGSTLPYALSEIQHTEERSYDMMYAKICLRSYNAST
ncbi:hypothetical protein PV326_000995 [Microctonus aethiopoides]|nr:hypothetical protein PV326_000995 [Microctonus aethiopoides]